MASKEPGKHTLAEVLSQPQVWQATVEGLAAAPDQALPEAASYDQILFVGCGSTHYLSQWAARHAQPATGVLSRAAPASELLLYPAAWLQPGVRTLLVAVSRSGETSETLRAVEAFKAGGYGDTLAITCYPEGSLARMADWALSAPAAQEESIAQTRSFTSMMLLAAWLLDASRPPDLGSRLASAGSRLIESWQGAMADLGADDTIQRLFFLGSGPLYGLASEAMLKMKEISLSYSEPYHFLEFRHGPMSMINRQSLVIGLLGELAEDYELPVLREMRQLGARTLILAESISPQAREAADFAIGLESGLPALWRAPLTLPALQLLAYHRARARGLDPDRPTHLEAVVVLDD